MSFVIAVNTAWLNKAPDWVIVLAKACDESSQNKVAKHIRYSNTVVNQILKANYKGSMDAVEQAVRGALMDYTVICPVLGQIHGNECRAHQRQKFTPTNAVRVKLYRACRSCPHSKNREA